MQRNYKIEVRLSESELAEVERSVARSNLKKSDWVRNKLLNNTATVDHSVDMCRILFDMQTNVNKAVSMKDNYDYLENIRKDMNELWLYLK